MAKKQLTDDELDKIIAQAAREYNELYFAHLDRLLEEEQRREHLTSAKLTPSSGGKECLGNGHWPGYERQCPDCDFYETCFPDWEGHNTV